MFEYEATIPKGIPADGDKPAEDLVIVLKFQDYGEAPGRISRHNIGDVEAQVWGYLEWGLTEPAKFPEDSTRAGHNVFDSIPQRQITECYQQWQKAERG